jgi:hypothetical protein
MGFLISVAFEFGYGFFFSLEKPARSRAMVFSSNTCKHGAVLAQKRKKGKPFRSDANPRITG